MLKIPFMAAVAIVVTASGIGGLEAQISSDPAFEVASIKPNNSGVQSTRISAQPGLYTATNVTVRTLIVNAYRLQDFQLSGGPGWMRSDHFDIVAKIPTDVSPASTAPPDDTPTPLELMVRDLLTDRFKRVVHTESRNAPIYALVAARSDKRLGPHLHPTAGDCAAVADQSTLKEKENKEKSKQAPARAAPALRAPGQRPCTIKAEPGRMSARGTTLATLANSLSGLLPRTVLDRTGINGIFDVELTWTPDQMPQSDSSSKPKASKIDPNGPSIFTALREQLGLKLESTKGPVDVLVVDRAERPTPN